MTKKLLMNSRPPSKWVSKNLALGALLLNVPILLSGCSSNTPATPISDYDKVSLIEYQECIVFWAEGHNTASFAGDLYSESIFQRILEVCEKYRPVKE